MTQGKYPNITLNENKTKQNSACGMITTVFSSILYISAIEEPEENIR